MTEVPAVLKSHGGLMYTRDGKEKKNVEEVEGKPGRQTWVEILEWETRSTLGFGANSKRNNPQLEHSPRCGDFHPSSMAVGHGKDKNDGIEEGRNDGRHCAKAV